MLEGLPVVLISYSERFKAQVAEPVANRLTQYGVRAILVGEEVLPAGVESNPEAKVGYFFDNADMCVFLATADAELPNGEVHTRPNIVDELRTGLDRPNLRKKLLVFKASRVELPSNTNPVYEDLPLDDPGSVVDRIVRQAQEWGVLPRGAPDVDSGASSPESSEELPEGPASVGAADDEATKQALGAVDQVSSALRNGGDVPLDAVGRSELVVAALAAESLTGDVLGAHTANRIFAGRHSVKPRPVERRLLLRTWLRRTRDDNTPGAFWLSGLTKADALALLISMARKDTEDEVRVQALRLLGRLKRPSSLAEARELICSFLTAEDDSLVTAGIAYIRDRGGRGLRGLLDGEELLARKPRDVKLAGALLDLPQRPGGVLQDYIDDAALRSDDLRTAILKRAGDLPYRSIRAALDSNVGEVQILGIELMRERSEPIDQLLLIVKASSTRAARLAALSLMLDRGERIDDDLLKLARATREGDNKSLTGEAVESELGVNVFLTHDPRALAGEIAWTHLDGPERYEALARIQPTAAARVRRDLRTDFADLIRESMRESVQSALAKTRNALGRDLTAIEEESAVTQAEQEWLAVWGPDSKVGSYLLDRYREAALLALSVVGRRADVTFARQTAGTESHSTALAALAVFERFGTAHDTDRILSLIARLYPEKNRVRGAELALRLAYKKDKLSVLERLRAQWPLQEWAVSRLADMPGGLTEAFSLLSDGNPAVRKAAAAVVWDRLAPEHRDRLISFYMEHRHFYNVVRWWDIQLYAPEWLLPAADAP